MICCTLPHNSHMKKKSTPHTRTSDMYMLLAALFLLLISDPFYWASLSRNQILRVCVYVQYVLTGISPGRSAQRAAQRVASPHSAWWRLLQPHPQGAVQSAGWTALQSPYQVTALHTREKEKKERNLMTCNLALCLYATWCLCWDKM